MPVGKNATANQIRPDGAAAMSIGSDGPSQHGWTAGTCAIAAGDADAERPANGRPAGCAEAGLKASARGTHREQGEEFRLPAGPLSE